MTAKTPREILDDNLRRAHAYAQAIEETFRKAIEKTTQVGREAEAVQIDFEAFAKNWAAMPAVAHDLAEAAGVDPSVFASSWGDALITIREQALENEAFKRTMQTSISDKIANARFLEWNFQWLEEVTPALIADFLSMVRSQGIMDDSLDELASRGEPATERLKWMAEWLKKNGYC